MKKNKFLLILLFITLSISCDTDDENDYSNQLIGEWIRNDFRNDFEYKLTFNSNGLGFKTVRSGTMETQIISSSFTINWSADETSLTIDELGTVITTKYTINSEGELILPDYSDLPFIKIE
ncbi:hypothetical protein [Lutibacter sp.]|uniref:hypothetical protein n=1 Tax=Lutibacter sp. TaxID=1925666 RepID=UPI0034A0173A